MGTRGLIAYKFRALGKSLSKDIPVGDSSKLEQWLKHQRLRFTKVEESIEDSFWMILSTTLAQAILTDPALETALHAHREFDLYTLPAPWTPPTDLFIEWIYTIDLDNEIFSVNNNIHFKLCNIPDMWTDMYEHDTDYEEDHRWPRFAVNSKRMAKSPKELVSLQLQTQVVEERLLSLYASLDTSIVRPKGMKHFLPGKQSAVRLAQCLFRWWDAKVGGQLDFLAPQWTTDNNFFRDIAFAFLCFASGFFEGLTLEGWLQPDAQTENVVFGKHISENPDLPVELVADICSGFHLQGRSPWIAPSEEFFWIDGILVHLCQNLDDVNIARSNIALLIEHGRSAGKQSFHGIILSLRHVVLIKVLPAGQIQHTQILQLMKYNEHDRTYYSEPYSSDTEPYYGFPGKRKTTNVGIPRSMRKRQTGSLEARCSATHQNENNKGEGAEDQTASLLATQPAHDSKDPLQLRIEEQTDAFAAIAHMFEAVKLERLSLNSSQGKLPSEIYMSIIDLTDLATRHQCSSVSRKFRAYCQQKFYFDTNVGEWHSDGSDEKLTVRGGDASVTYRLLMQNRRTQRRRGDNQEFYGGRKWVPIVGWEIGKRAAIMDAAFLLEKDS